MTEILFVLDQVASEKCFLLDFLNNDIKWEEIVSLPTGLFGGNMEYIDPYFYVLGGIVTKNELNYKVYRLDTSYQWDSLEWIEFDVLDEAYSGTGSTNNEKDIFIAPG